MADPSSGEPKFRNERGRRQGRSTVRRWWDTQFATNRPPGRLGRSPAFIFLWALLALAAGIAGVVTGELREALGFALLALGLVLATLMNMVRDEFVRWVAPLNLMALVIIIVGGAILWSG